MYVAISQTILLFVIVFLLGYITYQDISNRKERDKLQLKLMSRDTTEYLSAVKSVEEKPKDTKEEAEVYMDVDDVPPETLLKATDLT